MTAPNDIVIVNIDKASAENLHLPEDPEKWPRTYYARLIEQLNQNNPAIIAFNIYFGEERDPENDTLLAGAMAARKNVVLSNYIKQYTIPAAELSHEFRYEHIVDPAFTLEQAALDTAPFPLPKTSSTAKQFWAYKKSAGDVPTFPVTVFQCYALKKIYPEILQLLQQLDPGLAATLPKVFGQLAADHKAAETAKKIQTAFRSQLGDQLGNQSTSLTKLDGLLAEAKFSPENTRLLRSWLSLLKGDDSLYFNHYGKAQTITTLPFHQVLSGNAAKPALLRDKIILVGYSEDIEQEQNQGFYTDLSSDNGATISATEIAATAIANLINDSWLKPLPLPQQFLLILLWGFLQQGICRLFSYRLAVSLVVGLSTLYVIFAHYLFAAEFIWMPLFIPVLLQMPGVLMLATAAHHLKNKQDHRNMHQAFSFYLPDHVVTKIANHPDLKAMNDYGELMQGVCLASDAGQYTTLSEALTPLQLHSLMNQYYGVIFPHVKKTRGIISDVIGDAMLALWATPSATTEHRINACQAALDIKASVANFNQSQPHYLHTRLGLHYGEMRLGNVGAEDHYEYRAIGDIINTATRIEGLNKLLGTDILASAPVVEGLAGFFTREMGIFILKGKTVPVKIYELIAPIDQVQRHSLALNAAFGKALELFQSHQWTKALDAFLSLKKNYPTDGPTLFYIRYLTQQAPCPPQNNAGCQVARIEIGNIT